MKNTETYHQSSPETIQEMFSTIAENYDRANALFSLGMHTRWNNALIESIGPAETLLDLCAGTGEIAFGFLMRHPDSQAILLDFCPQMLEEAKKKGKTIADRFSTLQADAQEIPLEDNSVDGVTISYGIRNVKDPKKCFQEVKRVLKPGGHFGILELTRPNTSLIRGLHKVYTKTLLPILGVAVAKNIKAYRYLAKSVQTFSSPEQLERDLTECGFEKIKERALLFGSATLLLVKSV